MPSSIEDEPESTISTPTPQSTASSTRTDDIDSLAVTDTRRRRSSRIPEGFRRDRERALAGRSNRELIRLLIQEEYESKDTRNLLSAAFDRLELEARRVADAEARVLEVAERFRAVNDARLASHQEATQANAELKLYKYQYDLAQKEIFRAQDVLKVIEEQRDDATAAATRARDTARMYRENQLVYLAREEGRKMGYEEGLRHAKYEYGGVGAIDYAGRYAGSREKALDRLITEGPFNHVPSRGSVADDEHSPERVGMPEYSEAANRTMRAIQQPVRSPLLSPVDVLFHPGRSAAWDNPEIGTVTTPAILHNRISGPHPEPPIPPDKWIPHSEQDYTIPIPSAHEFEPQIHSPSSGTTWVHVSRHDQSPFSVNRPSLTIPEHNRRGSSPSPLSEAGSNGSTTFSQFDITATVPDDSSVLERKLSMIKEGSTPGELTPALSARRSRVENILTNTNTPALETDYGYSPATDMTLRSPAVAELVDSSKPNVLKPGDSRRNIMQRFADGLRYSDPDVVDTWRRSAAEELGPSVRPPRHQPSHLTMPALLSPRSAMSPNQFQTSSRSSDIPIDVHSPSISESYDEDNGPHTPGLLGPYMLPQARPATSPSDESFTSDEPRMTYPQSPRRSSNNGPPAMYGSGSQTPRVMSPDRDPRDKRRSKSTPRDPVNRSHTPHETVPMPENNYSYSGPRSTNIYAPKIASSHSAGSVDVGTPRESISQRAMHAGATPAHSGRPISAAIREVQKEATIRKTPSVSSSISGRSQTSSYKAYDPSQYLDPAYLASSNDDLSAPAAAPRSGNASGKGKWILGR